MSYIGEKEVKSIDGNLVEFVDGTSMSYTERQLEYITTDTPKDATEFRDHCMLYIVADVFKALQDHNIAKGLLPIVFQGVHDSLDKLYHEAVGKAFGTDGEDVYYKDMINDISISDIKRVREG